MSQLSAINQELLRQINDSVGYKIKTKVDYLYNTAGTNTANINYITAQTRDVVVPNLQGLSSNIKYLNEVTAINDISLSSTVDKSLIFHKFLTSEHIPASNIYIPLGSLPKTGDTYVTGMGACGVRKNGVDVFEEYYNGQYPGSMFGTFSCGKELMGLTLGSMQKKRVGLHNVAADGYTSNLLSLDTKVYDIIYGTDINVYGQFGITLPLGLDQVRMRDLFSMRAGFDEYDALLWFMTTESALTGGDLTSYPTSTPLSYSYIAWANDATRLGTAAITNLDDIKKKGSATVSVREFARFAYNDIVQKGTSSAYDSISAILSYAFYNSTFSSNNFMGEFMVGSGFSNTSTRYHRTSYATVYGQDKLENYNNECISFATYMLQLALFKEAINGGAILSSSYYSNTAVSITDVGAKTFGASGPNTTYVNAFRNNFRTFFNHEILAPSTSASVNTNLTLLQSDKYGAIMPDNTRVVFPHLMGIADKFSSDLFAVRDSNIAVTTVFSNLYLSNITEYNFTSASSNIVPRLLPFDTDPFETPTTIGYGELVNSNNYYSFTNGVFTMTDVLPNNKQRSSNVYLFSGAQGQKFVMGRDATTAKNRYTYGSLSDDITNNPLLCQGNEFLQTYKNTIDHYRVESASYGKTDSTSLLIGKWYPDYVSVPYFAAGAGILTGLRTRQESDKAIAYIQDIKTSSNTWGYDSVGGPSFRLNTNRAYFSNLTNDVNIIKVANIYTGNVVVTSSNCVADVYYTHMDIFNRAKSTF